MKKHAIFYGVLIFFFTYSCYDSEDKIFITNTIPTLMELTVSGNLTVNSVLTATYTFYDADGDQENGTTYQWYTAEDALGSNKQLIPNATSNTYTLTEDNLNQYIGFDITPHDGIEAGEIKTSAFFGPVNQQDSGNGNLTGQELLDYLKIHYAPPSASNDQYDYDHARDIMYSKIWIQNTTQLTGIYTGFTITMDLNQDPSSYAATNDINTEHIYPQSKGADQEPMRSDMHHLAPSKSNVNSSRGNLPYGNVSDNQATRWYQNANQYNSDPDGLNGDSEAYSKKNSSLFEPRDEVKGDVARAIMYFYTMYNSADASFFNGMKTTLLEWNRLDPVDEFERSRNQKIKAYQGNENPYILDETLADRAFSN
ncbi:MAG: endonuclease [Flavobacteriales bacterium]